jgi:leucyl aminopeptidase
MQIHLSDQLPSSGFVLRLYKEGEQPSASGGFSAKRNEQTWASAEEAWLGLGSSPSLGSILKTVRVFFHKQAHRLPPQLGIDIQAFTSEEVEAIVNGVWLGSYTIALYKSTPPPSREFYGASSTLTLCLDASELRDPKWSEAIERATHTAEVQIRCMDLMNAPGNKKPPRILAEWALESGRKWGYKVTVLEKDSLEALGFEALLSVSKGSVEPPVLIQCEHHPEVFEKTVVLVGKGVTFDTGGISIKASSNLHLMKSDMGGAAAVLGAVELAARLKLPVRVIGIIPSTENCIDGASTKPGDVIGSYSGQTIEVIDTDAEGRLILADGLSYATQQFEADVLIDVATLTGSVIQTLGYHAAGLFTTNDSLAASLTASGERTGERVWRLPLWPEYEDEVKSDIADLRNYHGKPVAGAIVAAAFLQAFTRKHPAWAHLDIAGMAFGDTDLFPNRAGTAYGIRLLYDFMAHC